LPGKAHNLFDVGNPADVSLGRSASRKTLYIILIIWNLAE